MTQASRQRSVDKARATTKRYRRRRNSQSAGADAQRARRGRRKLFYELGTVLTEVGRLGEWDEACLPAIKRAICRLLSDYIAFVKTHSFDPVSERTMSELFELLNSITVEKGK
jgi:hypothetical protein